MGFGNPFTILVADTVGVSFPVNCLEFCASSCKHTQFLRSANARVAASSPVSAALGLDGKGKKYTPYEHRRKGERRLPTAQQRITRHATARAHPITLVAPRMRFNTSKTHFVWLQGPRKKQLREPDTLGCVHILFAALGALAARTTVAAAVSVQSDALLNVHCTSLSCCHIPAGPCFLRRPLARACPWGLASNWPPRLLTRPGLRWWREEAPQVQAWHRGPA